MKVSPLVRAPPRLVTTSVPPVGHAGEPTDEVVGQVGLVNFHDVVPIENQTVADGQDAHGSARRQRAAGQHVHRNVAACRCRTACRPRRRPCPRSRERAVIAQRAVVDDRAAAVAVLAGKRLRAVCGDRAMAPEEKRTRLFLHLKKWLEKAVMDYGMIAAGDRSLWVFLGGWTVCRSSICSIRR